MQKKYQFFYLKTGGGHLAPAKSVSKFLEQKHPDQINIELIDGLNQGPTWLRSVLEDGYRKAQSGAQWTFEAIYALNKIPPLARATAKLVTKMVEPYLAKTILEGKPEKIVIFHFLLIAPIINIIKKHKLNIPVFTVVTDPYTAHPIWFLNKETEFIVFSDEVKKICLKHQIASEKIRVFPFIIDEKFTLQLTPEQINQQKERFGLSDKKTILIMGGGDGLQGGSKIVKKLINNNIDANIVIVCGRNQKLFAKSSVLKAKNPDINIQVFGFVDFVYELINIADVVVTKCGASTFMEILHLKKIPVINNYIWEQEKGNMEYVVNNQMGIFEKKFNKLTKSVNKILSDNLVYQEFINNISAKGLTNGTPEVAGFIDNY